MCPKNCTHQRKVMVGGRRVSDGFTIRDIVIQITGP
jgi:hypothetical protein